MKEIWKFPLAVVDSQEVLMPKGARILSIQTQNEIPCIWAMVEADDAEIESRQFETFGTGHQIPEIEPDQRKERQYIGTYQIKLGALVFHVFELGEISPITMLANALSKAEMPNVPILLK